MKINEIMAGLEARHPGEKEFHQAVREVLLSVEDVYNQHPEWEADIRNTFAQRWIDRAQAGWWVQRGGAWVKK